MTQTTLEKSLDLLRRLRSRAQDLNSHVVDDLRPFRNGELATFRRLPTSASDPSDVNATTTCTALMTLAVTRNLGAFYGDDAAHRKAFGAIRDVVADRAWSSSNLPQDNAFTTIMVLRAAGFLVKHGGMKADDILTLSHNGTPLGSILLERSKSAPENLKVAPYEPTPTLVYWFVDAIDSLKYEKRVLSSSWEALAKWTASQFTSQVSLLVARHETRMDPVAMAMAACLTSRLRRILNSIDEGWARTLLETLPSQIELREGVRLFFKEQALSGVWPKYFPLFHYPAAGSNYTFTFELLEAVLHEFGTDSVMQESATLERLERAVQWCESNRVKYDHQDKSYVGWNSGGQYSTLVQGLPESWATGVVHMFLSQLGVMLAHAIQGHLLERYSAVRTVGVSRKDWDGMLATRVQIASQTRKMTVTELLEEEILKNLKEVKGFHEKLRGRHSALLFGPPGTSKTSLVKAFAKAAGWPYVEINPSHFLSEGLDKVYIRANQIFEDLMDLSNCAVLLDEMDTLVRRRPGDDSEQPLDVTREFLTTTMLPKLAALHGRSRVVFFVATNHQRIFDEAIKRPGRFDLHVFMGVPSWKEKRKALHHFIPNLPPDEKECKAELERIGACIDGWLKSHKKLKRLLDLFSFGEMKSFFEEFIEQNSLSKAFDKKRDGEFRKSVHYWGTRSISLRKYENPDPLPGEKRRENSRRTEYEYDRTKSRKQ